MAEHVDEEQAIATVMQNLKSKGIFDQIRRDCLADITTKSSFLNLNQRIDGNVKLFLKNQTWHSGLNKNQLREQLRNNLNECTLIKGGVSHLVEQVVNPMSFRNKIDEEIRLLLGIEKEELSIIEDKLDDISDDEDEILKQEEQPKVTEKEFSKKFINTFSEAKISEDCSSANVEIETKKDEDNSVHKENSQNLDITMPQDMEYSNSSISDGSLTCGLSPQRPAHSPLGESNPPDLTTASSSIKMEDEIANELQEDLKSVNQIYKHLVVDSSMSNQVDYGRRGPEGSKEVTFTANQLSFKNKFNTPMGVPEENEVPLISSSPAKEDSKDPLSSISDDSRFSVPEATVSNNDSESAFFFKEDIKTEAISTQEVNESIERTNLLDLEKVPPKELKEEKRPQKDLKEDKAGTSKNFKNFSRSDSQKKSKTELSREKEEKLNRIKERLKEKCDQVKQKLNESGKKVNKEEPIKKVKSEKLKKGKSIISDKFMKKDEKRKSKSNRASFGINKGKDQSPKKLNQKPETEFDSDVSSVHTSDLSDFDDQISLSSEDEDKKKKISIQQLKQILK